MKLEKRTLKNGQVKHRGRFMINYTHIRTPWMNTVDEVKDEVARLRSNVKAGSRTTGSMMGFEEFSKLWLEKHAFVNKVFAAALRDEQSLRCHVNPRIGNEKLRNLKTAQIDFLISDLRREGNLSPKSINNVLGTLKKLLNDAVRWGYISNNPAKLVAPLKVPRQDVLVLSDDEVVKLLAYARTDYPEEFRFLVFALNTGCRLGECYSLGWAKVDLKDRFATIDMTYDAKKKKFVQRTKGKNFRKIPLNDECVRMLGELKLLGRQSQCWRIFTKINYDYMTHELFKRMLRKAGLDSALGRGITFHSLRHTFATKFMRAGGNLYELQHLLGHANITQTEKYAHYAPTYLAGATNRVSFSVHEADNFFMPTRAREDGFARDFARK